MTVFFSGAIFIPGAGGLLCLIVAALGSSSFHPVGTVQATLQGRNHLAGRETTATSLFFTAGQLGHFVGPIITGLILARLGLPALVILPVISIPIGLALAYPGVALVVAAVLMAICALIVVASWRLIARARRWIAPG